MFDFYCFSSLSNNWIGFVITLGEKRIYYAGDTDRTPEMDAVRDIDLALMPVGGTYTLDGPEAAEAVDHFKPRRALPYHWGDIVGSRADADKFAELAGELEKNGVSHEKITYSGAPHAFTVFGSNRYREEADKKSWKHFTTFLTETLN